MAHFFAAQNLYGSPTSVGFANTWVVRVFDSREARDSFVESARDLSTRAITKKEIGRYYDRPKPFSGQAYCIRPAWMDSLDNVDGLVGTVEVTTEPMDRLY
jgi:hypothetical protein